MEYPQIRSKEDIQSFADSTQNEISKLKGSIGDLKDLYKIGYKEQPGKPSFGRFNDFFKALFKEDHGKLIDLGGAVYNEAREAMGDYGTKAALGTALVGSAITGQYLVPNEYYNEIQRAINERSVMMPLVKSIPMGTRTMYIPVRGTMPTLAWITGADTADVSESNPTFVQKSITAYQLASFVPVSEALLEDENTLLVDYLSQSFTEDFGDELDNQILNGTGTPTTGLLQDGSVNIVTMDQGKPNFDSIELDDVYALISAVPYQKYRRGASFVCNPVITDYLRLLKDANGRFLWVEPTATTPGTLAGYPVFQCDAAPGTSAVSTAFMTFGNYKYFCAGVRVQLEVKVFSETSYAVTNCEWFVRARARYGFVNTIPAAFSKLVTSAN